MNIQKINYLNTEFETMLDKELGIIKEKYSADAQHLVSNNLPASGEAFSMYWAEHHSKFENLITVINQHLKSDALLYQVRQIAEAASAEKQDLQNRRKEVLDTLADHCREQPTQPDFSPARLAGIKTTVAAIAMFEALYTGPVFMQIGLSWIEAAVASSLLAVALTAYYHNAPLVIERASNSRQKRIVFICIWLLPVIFFYFIGTGRADYLTQVSQEDGGEGIIYSPWLFITTSIIMSITALMLALFQPDKEAGNQYKRYKTWKRKKTELEIQLGDIEKHIKAADTNTRANALAAADTYESGHILEQRVITSARSGFEDFKKRIVTRRGIAGGPSMQEPYPFTFNTNFDYKSSKSHE